jgi:hypothetical protein
MTVTAAGSLAAAALGSDPPAAACDISRSFSRRISSLRREICEDSSFLMAFTYRRKRRHAKSDR